MISSAAKQQLIKMKLSEISDILTQQEGIEEYMIMGFDDRMEYLINSLYEIKHEKTILGLRRRARLKVPDACINSIIWDDRGLDKNKILNLATGNFVLTQSNIICTGPTGAGKTYMACAVANDAAINQGFITKYVRMPDMLTELHLPETNRRKLRRKYAAPEVLILDEWLTSEDILDEDVSFLLDLMEDRCEAKSTVFCTLYPCSQWNDKLKRRVIGQSVIDRIIHNSVIVDCGTKNMRAEKRKTNR